MKPLKEIIYFTKMAKLKSSYTRHNVWPGVKAYIEYVEHLGKHYNAEDGDFYDAIILDF